MAELTGGHMAIPLVALVLIELVERFLDPALAAYLGQWEWHDIFKPSLMNIATK
jgi:hypothetical protein